FSIIGSAVRPGIAALDRTSGVATAWNPAANFPNVRALAVSPDGATVYAGGNFYEIGDEHRDDLAALDAATGHATDWNPGADAPVHALVTSGDEVFAGGEFSQVGT